MTNRAALSALLLLWPSIAFTQAPSDYDRHVAFDNSLTAGSYHYSDGNVVAPSELELVDGRFPVEDTTCAPPPNCLRLKWRSQRGGDWRMTVQLTRHYTTASLSGDTLSFSVWSDSDIPAAASPLIQVTDASGVGSPTIRLFGTLDRLPAKRWIRVLLPFSSFIGLYQQTGETTFDPAPLASLTIVQGLDDGAPHSLSIDDVRIADATGTSDTSSP